MLGMGNWVWMKRGGGKGCLWAVVIYCNGAIEQRSSGCNNVVGCCNIPVRVKRWIERGEYGCGDYLGVLVIVFEDV